jgi:DNA-binding CsgD family transcriptional regulator
MAGRSRLIERDGDLARLGAALDRALEEGHGGSLLIEGPAGVGKTALLEALTDRAAAAGHRVLRARGSEMEREFGFGLVRQLFGPLLRESSPREEGELFDGPPGLAAPVFGLGGEDLEVSAAEGSLYGLYWLLARIAERAPVVLAIDDAQWSDTSSLRFVRYLVHRLQGLPVLVTLAARPNEPGVGAEMLASLSADLELPVLRPAPLSEAGTAAIVNARVGSADGAAIAPACHEATGGNPFLIGELLTELTAAGEPSPDRIAAMGLERIAAGVGERAGRLGPDGVAVVQAAAVLGDAADLRALAALADSDRDRVDATVDALAAAAILSPGPGKLFVHPLVRTAVYEDIPAARRAALHAGAATVLAAEGADPEAVAAHLLLCEPGGVETALASLDSAATSAASRGAPDSAATYLGRALEERPDPARRAELLHRLGIAEVLLRRPTSLASLREAAELAPDPERALESWLALIEMLFIAGQWDAAGDACRTALERFEGSDLPGLLELKALHASGLGYHPDLVAEYERGLPAWLGAVADRDDDDALRLRWVLGGLGAIREEPRAAVLELLEPISAGWVRSIAGRESSLLNHGLLAAILVDAFDGSREVVDALLDYGRARGSVLAIVSAVGNAALFEQRRGDLSAAEADLRMGIEVLRENEFSAMALATALNFCLDTIVERTGLDDVAAMVEGLEVPPPLSQTFWGAMALEVRAAVRLRNGERAAAIADLRGAERVYRPLRIGPRFSPWRTRLASALPDSDREEALALAAEEIEIARAIDSPRGEGVALRTLGNLVGGERGVADLRRSVAILRDSPARLELARSLADLGAALRRGNHRGEARETLREAADLAQRCGADRLGERIEEEQKIAGARPRRRALSGTAALTPGEHRVVSAAAGGATNREIAQDLFVSLRTVEMHLTNAYRKLDISSRSELGAALADGDSRDDTAP